MIPVAPDIAIHHQKGFCSQKGERRRDATRSFECLVLGGVLDFNPPLMTITECLLKQRAEPSVVNDDLSDACRSQFFNMPLNEGFACDRDQGFGQGIGQRTHPFTAPCGENHGAHQNVYPTLVWTWSSSSRIRIKGLKAR